MKVRRTGHTTPKKPRTDPCTKPVVALRRTKNNGTGPRKRISTHVRSVNARKYGVCPATIPHKRKNRPRGQRERETGVRFKEDKRPHKYHAYDDDGTATKPSKSGRGVREISRIRPFPAGLKTKVKQMLKYLAKSQDHTEPDRERKISKYKYIETERELYREYEGPHIRKVISNIKKYQLRKEKERERRNAQNNDDGGGDNDDGGGDNDGGGHGVEDGGEDPPPPTIRRSRTRGRTRPRESRPFRPGYRWAEGVRQARRSRRNRKTIPPGGLRHGRG